MKRISSKSQNLYFLDKIYFNSKFEFLIERNIICTMKNSISYFSKTILFPLVSAWNIWVEVEVFKIITYFSLLKFMWKVCHSSLPIRGTLHHRGVSVPNLCPLFDNAEETIFIFSFFVLEREYHEFKRNICTIQRLINIYKKILNLSTYLKYSQLWLIIQKWKIYFRLLILNI